MAVDCFPPLEYADEQGLLAIGGDLEVSSLLQAYSQGIFPWPVSRELPLAWFSPDPRGILFYKDLVVSRSLRKKLRKNEFKISFNKNFEKVIENCAYANRNETWITSPIIHAYCRLFQYGYAYSVEVADSAGELVGGLYGVCYGRFISGESMFYYKSNASKIALVKLMEHLHGRGIHWLDTQMITPVVASLGGVGIPRKKYLQYLDEVDYSGTREMIFDN